MKTLKTIIKENKDLIYTGKIAIGDFGPVLYWLNIKDLTNEQLSKKYNNRDWIIEGGDLCFNAPYWKG